MTPGLSLFFHMSDLTNWLFLVYVGETLYITTKSVKGFEKTSKLLKKESWLSALEELVSFYLIYIISRGGDYSIEIIIDMFSRIFFLNPTIKKNKV